MKAVKKSFGVFPALIIILVLGGMTQAQSREEAISTFNEGFALFSEEGDNLAAIEKFKETIEIAEQAGPEADDIRERAEDQIPRLAFMHGAQLVRNRELVEAIDAFQEAMRLGEKYGDEQIASRARGNLPALHLNLGNQYYREEQNEEALEQYEKAIELNPSYVSAYHQKGLVYRRFGDLDTSLENFDIAIDLAEEAGDEDNLERSQRSARDYLVYRASQQLEEENYNRALDFLNRAAGYGESASLHYRFAEAYNFLERHSEALESAQQALELEDGGPSDQARIYFEIGQAHSGLGNTEAACDAFENALYGDFRDLAEHQIEHVLNCD